MRQCLIAKVGKCGDRDRYSVGCPCITILKPAFLKQGDCFIWRQADSAWLAGKWDVIKGLRDGVEKAWLQKDEEYVQGSVAAEAYHCEVRNSQPRHRFKVLCPRSSSSNRVAIVISYDYDYSTACCCLSVLPSLFIPSGPGRYMAFVENLLIKEAMKKRESKPSP